MDEPNEEATGDGLPWPEAYADMRPVIGEQWGIESEIYLNRQLSGGKSGAMVYLADVTGREFAGQAILKLDAAPDAALQEQSEADRHREAQEAEPDFARRHLPRIIHTAHQGDSLAILSTIAARGLEFAVPWSECDHDRQIGVVQRLSRTLLEDWNRAAKLAPGLLSPQTLLQSWLTYRLDPEESRLHDFLAQDCGLSPNEPSLTFEGVWYPNPLAFAMASPERFEKLKLRALLGQIHGDLHGHNVLVSKTGSERDYFYMIDLAFYEGRQYLFFDHGYFALAYLLSARGQANADHWQSILNDLCPFDHIRANTGVRGDDIGILQLLKSLRAEVINWVDTHEANRLSYMESQFQLAQVAAGLNFAQKRLPDRERRMAFLFAASVLRDYLILHDVDWPKHGPAFTLDGAPEAAKPTPPPAEPTEQPVPQHPGLPEKPAIAVLAFENQSGEPEQEYFADGVTDEIIMALSRVDWLMVISRGSTFSYKGRTVDAKTVGKELGVHYVVEGVVRKAGDRVRVTAQLVDAQDGKQLWADRFDRHLEDIFELQDEIATAIASNIDDSLKITERDRAKRKGGQVSLWDAYQQAMWHLYKFNPEDTETARTLLSDLVEKSPDFAAAHASLALVELRGTFMGEGDLDRLDELMADAHRHADRAVELDEGSSVARIALSRIYAFQGKYDQAIEEANKCVALNPSSTVEYLNLAGTLLWGERADAALSAIEISLRLSPKGPLLPVKQLVKALAFYLLLDFVQAETLLRQAQTFPPLSAIARLLLAAVLIRQEREDEARATVSEALALRPEISLTRFRTAWRTLSPHYRDIVLEDLRKAGVPD